MLWTINYTSNCSPISNNYERSDQGSQKSGWNVFRPLRVSGICLEGQKESYEREGNWACFWPHHTHHFPCASPASPRLLVSLHQLANQLRPGWRHILVVEFNLFIRDGICSFQCTTEGLVSTVFVGLNAGISSCLHCPFFRKYWIGNHHACPYV